MRYYVGVAIGAFAFGACGAAVIETPPPMPRKVLVTNESTLKEIATDFVKDCYRYIGKERCALPYRINLAYFEPEEQPDLRGYAQPWTYRNVVGKVHIGIVSYLKDNPTSLKVVTYHELFHAYFELDHDDTKLGIMNTYGNALWDGLIMEDFQHYVAEEFYRVKK